MEKIRTFIAIPLPREIIDELRKLVDNMRRVSREVKWVKPESIHLTLKFLGGLTSEELEEVFAGVEEILPGAEGVGELTIGGLGAFPNMKRPRVLWVGVKGEGLESLKNLQNRIENSLAQKGFPKEDRKFSPHLTVGRIKIAGQLEQLLNAFISYQFPAMNFTPNRIEIMRSDLKPSGAVYSVQKSCKL